MSSLICKKCNKSTMKWVSDPDISNAKFQCPNCGKTYTMESYIHYWNFKTIFKKLYYKLFWPFTWMSFFIKYVGFKESVKGMIKLIKAKRNK